MSTHPLSRINGNNEIPKHGHGLCILDQLFTYDLFFMISDD